MKDTSDRTKVTDSALVSLRGTVRGEQTLNIPAPRPDSAVVSVRLPLTELNSALSAIVALGHSAIVALNGEGSKVASTISALSSAPAKISAFVSIAPSEKKGA